VASHDQALPGDGEGGRGTAFRSRRVGARSRRGTTLSHHAVLNWKSARWCGGQILLGDLRDEGRPGEPGPGRGSAQASRRTGRRARAVTPPVVGSVSRQKKTERGHAQAGQGRLRFCQSASTEKMPCHSGPTRGADRQERTAIFQECSMASRNLLSPTTEPMLATI